MQNDDLIHFDVDLALLLSKIVHDRCSNVPHDIGISLAYAVHQHQSPFDPVTLNNDPEDEPREFDDGQIKRRFEKEWPELFDKVGELEDKIETGDIPECCAGHWVLFGCHSPHCTNGGVNGNG